VASRGSKLETIRAVGACLLAAVVLLCCSWAFAAAGARAAGLEGSSSLSELSQQAESSEGEGSSSETSTPKTSTEKESSSSTGKSTIFIGAGAALLLLLGIAYVIVKDARRVAPAGISDDFQDGPRGRDRAVEMRNRRAKARAARRQRKKNR
jgi:hypothetical protein